MLYLTAICDGLSRLRNDMLIVTYNIQWGKGRDDRIDLRRIADAVSGADVIALQEVERHWRDQEFSDQALRLSELIPGYHWIYGAAVDLGSPVRNLRRQIGNMVLSRYAITSARHLPLPARPVQGHVNDQQQMIEAVIGAGAGFRLYNTHLNYLSPGQRSEQLDLALRFIAEAPERGGAITMPGRESLGPEDDWIVLPGGKPPTMPQPAIFAGDFNCGPESAEFRTITEAGFSDCLARAGLGPKQGVTFPGGGGEPPQRLDHLFLSPELAPHCKRAWIDHIAEGSDHQPVWLELQWP